MLIKGIVLGLAIAAPVGPIGLLCIQSTLKGGFRNGIITGLGAATADALYALGAMMGLTGLLTIIGKTSYLQIIGALFLLYVAWKTRLRKRKPLKAIGLPSNLWRCYFTTFLLTLSNPMTILSFATMFAGLGLTQADLGKGLLLVIGVFLGSMLWWICLSSLFALVAQKLDPSWLRRIDLCSALLLFFFAVSILWAPLKAFARLGSV
ncbi:threonine/homoserine/homoserine lactone efflux protein [Pseudomonas duriflava]|uniref:Threonine/homoserine/homoserine lactone efflux protein n=1 Tax=Pseudomonas duriflava TaxID=459528 RepID=A0A562PLD8_9PSED|nr:LysE family transporter [Pseudomonas duriflava]TWI45198.1 threonine/homoserine/homoserine lactone efflux protein [Pseudomonas duriflava]